MDPLLEAALRAREHAVAPYSQFRVGAAVEDEEGRVFTGCNIENSTFGLTVCAERVAVWKALSEGVRRFRRIAVVAGSREPTPPCGACRQILWEFCGDLEVVMANLQGRQESVFLRDLLPRAFHDAYLR